MGCCEPTERERGELLMADYLTTDTELASIANAIRTKGGTSAQLEYPSGFVTAIGDIQTGGGATPKTVTITLTNPVNDGEAGAPACFVYESDDGNDCTQIGSIPSPTGSVTVTVSKNLCLVEPNSSSWSAGYGSTLYDAYVIQGSFEKGRAFYVFGDAQLTVRGIDYDD